VFHQELDAVATGAQEKAVVELLGHVTRHDGDLSFVEGGRSHEFPWPFFLEHHVLATTSTMYAPHSLTASIVRGRGRPRLERRLAQGMGRHQDTTVWKVRQDPILTEGTTKEMGVL